MPRAVEPWEKKVSQINNTLKLIKGRWKFLSYVESLCQLQRLCRTEWDWVWWGKIFAGDCHDLLDGTTPTFSFRSWVKSLKSSQYTRKCEGDLDCFSAEHQTRCSPLHPLNHYRVAWHSILCIMILSAKIYRLCPHSSYVENIYSLLHWYYTERVASSGVGLYTV
jgi:hypothetical protein